MRDYLINKLRSAKALRLDASRPQSVEKVHSTDHLTARERTALLLDPGSEVEFGAPRGSPGGGRGGGGAAIV